MKLEYIIAVAMPLSVSFSYLSGWYFGKIAGRREMRRMLEAKRP